MRQLIGRWAADDKFDRQEWAQAGLVVPLVCLMLWTVSAFFGFGADDGLIVARYARNALDGYGLVFNPGETVSALTSPFHAFIMIGLTAITDSPVAAYKLVSYCMVLATIGWMTLRFFPDRSQRPAFIALTAASPFVVVWTVGGLETPLLLCTLGLFCIAAWNDEESADRPASTMVYFLAALAFLIRHDSALFTAPVVAWQILVNRHSVKHWVALSAAAVAPFGWLLFSLGYYGDIFPTSFYWKQPVVGWNVVSGVIYLLSFLTLSGVWLAFFAGRAGQRAAAVLRGNRPLLVGLALFGAYATTAGIVHMMFSYRIFVPFVPIVMLMALKAAGGRNPARVRSMAVAAAAIVLQAGLSLVVYTTTLNPTLFHAFGTAAPKIFEYPRVDLRNYADGFLPAMIANADETRADWASRGHRDRSPRIHTFAAGVLPYHFEEAHIFDSLSGYRHGCDREWTYWRRAADYMHIMWPRQGLLEEQLGPMAATAELVSRRVVTFDGEREHIDVYFNPRPAPIRNSDRIDRPCE